MNNFTNIPGHQQLIGEWPSIPFKIMQEGKTKFRVAEAESIYESPAFFNPVMVLNRDLSILFIRLLSSKKAMPIRIFDPLAGIGIRALRIAIEASDLVSEIVINDFNEISTAIASYNITILRLQDKIILFKRDARSLTYNLAENHLKYHYVDLDPFGPPTPFIDSIWSVLPLNGLVSITATDMTALCGVYPNACLRKYGAIPLNNYHTHETAARILIATIVRSAARHERGVLPIFTASVDHYTKVFLEVSKGRGDANASVGNIGFSYTCSNCYEIRYIKGIHVKDIKCCGEISIAGPLWTGDIFEKTWCTDALDLLENEDISNGEEHSNFPSIRRMRKLFEEGANSMGLPGYYAMDEISRKLKITQPKYKLVAEKLNNLGYRCVQTRFTKQAFRSDAPGYVIKEVIKELVEN